jgi:glycyl-tRNA synthetase
MADTSSMDRIMALCKRRGFIFQASDIYGGINGFWDYGPLGSQLKKNLRDAWWNDLVMVGPGDGPDGRPVQLVPVDTCIIQNPKVWEASGHVEGFNDPMVDDKETKQRFRADHLQGLYSLKHGSRVEEKSRVPRVGAPMFLTSMASIPIATIIANNPEEAVTLLCSDTRLRKTLGIKECHELDPVSEGNILLPSLQIDHGTFTEQVVVGSAYLQVQQYPEKVPSPYSNKTGTLTEPRPFNLMFPTIVGALGDWETDKAYLRPETAQGIFINFKNVVDTMRVKVPFGIAQTGKAFRNEVTPRNFTFRSREFEQMEIEFFVTPDELLAPGEATIRDWYEFWRDSRMAWWESIGLKGKNLQLREHDKDELAHYAKEGAGTSDIEYRFPFTAPGFGELEGVAHRTDYDLRRHEEFSRQKLKYFDPDRGELAKNGQPKGLRYLPHVIEPSAGLDRGVLALLCEAYTHDESRASKEFMRFAPRLAPIKAAVFPLVNKDGMPEVAEKLHRELHARFCRLGGIAFDAKQSIGKRYARMDEAGCPFCFTIDGDTLTDQTVIVRDRDTADQQRIAINKVGDFLAEKLGV